MNSWFVLVLFGTLLTQVTSRPQQAEYNNDSDIEETEEEDDNDSTANDSYVGEEDMQLNDQEAGVQEEDVPLNRHLDLADNTFPARARAKPKVGTIAITTRHRKAQDENINASANFLEEPGSYPTRRQSSRYMDANEEQQEIQRLINRDVSKSNSDQNQDEDQLTGNKHTNSETTANEEDLIFDKNKEPVSEIQRNEYNANNDASDSEQPRYYKKYYNTLHTDRRNLVEDKHHEGRYYLRDRRDIKEVNASDDSNIPNSQSSNDKSDTEREESAIHKHLKKLSSAELNQLLNSLSEDKRELLKKTIEDTESSTGYVNKREITKKAGALEENNYNENCQSDLSKVQGGSPITNLNTDSASNPNPESLESHSKPDSQSDNSEPTQKSSDLSLTSANDLEVSSFSDGDTGLNTFNINSKNPADIVPDIPVTSKTDKRETKLEDLNDADMSLDDNNMSGQDYFNDQEYSSCAQDENSNILDDADNLQPDKTFKREAYYDKDMELSDSMKSLEESFPNSKAYDNSGDSEPLVRVKRLPKNLPDAKVAFVPYKAENDDEDNDEGNEFDDEGFYDRTSYLANSNAGLDEEALAKPKSYIRTNSLKTDDLKSVNENLEGDMRSLGSDTDSVLSGMEGVDENLMYSNGARSRRTVEVNPIESEAKADSSTLLTEDENKSASENNINLPNYQENDAFGPLPRNYDGDSARYKRIRRVKQLRDAQELNSSET